VPGARVDFLESMLQWHLDTSTSADLVTREVQDAIVAEVTSFPVDKVAVGESPSVAMHVPIPLLRASPGGPPSSLAAMGARSARGRAIDDATDDSASSSYGLSGLGRPFVRVPGVGRLDAAHDGDDAPRRADDRLGAERRGGDARVRRFATSAADDEESRDRDPSDAEHKGGDSVQILLPLNPAVFEEDLARLSSGNETSSPTRDETARRAAGAQGASRG